MADGDLRPLGLIYVAMIMVPIIIGCAAATFIFKFVHDSKAKKRLSFIRTALLTLALVIIVPLLLSGISGLRGWIGERRDDKDYAQRQKQYQACVDKPGSAGIQEGFNTESCEYLLNPDH